MNELFRPGESPLHRLDARAKLVLTLAFLVALSLAPFDAWPAFLLFFALAVGCELASGLGVSFFLKRALLAIPFMLAAAPLIFTAAGPRLSLPGDISVSVMGLQRFAGLAVKAWISVQAAILLAATTRFPDLLAAMRALKMPAIFVAVIGLMGRYLAFITAEAQSLLRARASRSPEIPGRRAGGTLAWRAGVAGGMAGSLFLRSLERSDRVYAAMLSRGYTGDLPSRPVPALEGEDLFAILAGMGLLGAIVIFSLFA